MNKILALLGAMAICLAARAQPDAPAEMADRARISAERSQAEARYAAQEKACRGRFATNDCINEARAQRREVLADLRRQEISLNDAQRRAKGAQRQRGIEEQSQKDSETTRRREQALADQLARQQRAAQKGAPRSAASAHAVGQKAPRPGAAGVRAPADPAANRERAREREAEAQQHRAQLKKRLAEQHRAPAAPLPTPP